MTVIYPIVLCGIFNPRNVAPLADRKRKPKFSKEELDILVTEVTHHEAVLFGRETMRLSHADRDKIWEGIARKITSVSQVPRSVKDIKHRWDDMKRRTKDKLAFMQQSLSGPGAGGRAPTIVLTAHERAIESALLSARSGHSFPRAELDGTDSPSTSCEYHLSPLPRLLLVVSHPLAYSFSLLSLFVSRIFPFFPLCPHSVFSTPFCSFILEYFLNTAPGAVYNIYTGPALGEFLDSWE